MPRPRFPKDLRAEHPEQHIPIAFPAPRREVGEDEWQQERGKSPDLGRGRERKLGEALAAGVIFGFSNRWQHMARGKQS